jgi:hypothetical protein
MKTYSAQNLKSQFPEFLKYSDFSLIPAIDTISSEWLVKIKESDNQILTDLIKLRKNNYFSPNDSYYAVVNGKIIEITTSGASIDILDKDEHWYMIKAVNFFPIEDKNPETSQKNIEVIFNHLFQFSAQQSLEGVIQKSKSELRKGKTYHLNREMIELYGLNK